MEELLRVIMVKWESDEGGRVREYCPGGLWLTEAPQTVIDDGSTYAVYYPMGGSYAETFGTQIEEPIIQFSIFATSEDSENANAPAWKARDALVAVYDDALMEMEEDADGNARRMITFNRMGHGLLVKEPDQGYACHIEYQVQYTFEK